MRAGVIGAGYVGVATAVALSRLGHRVMLVEMDPGRRETLQAGDLPFHEPGLAAALAAEEAKGSLQIGAACPSDVDVALICVGTPGRPDGAIDAAPVHAAAAEVAAQVRAGAVIAIKSTVPPGTAARIRAALGPRVGIVSNPEFLREGEALRDALEPSRIIIGACEAWAGERIERLYAAIGSVVVRTTLTEAELIKLASNAMLAAKIGVANELADWARALGASWEVVARGVSLDPRIGAAGLQAGLGFGGPCLPKDLAGTIAAAAAAGV
ncbi:MAG TPA: nucleotide sugar dehydrogenase, partial [Limnochordia bacterium]